MGSKVTRILALGLLLAVAGCAAKNSAALRAVAKAEANVRCMQLGRSLNADERDRLAWSLHILKELSANDVGSLLDQVAAVDPRVAPYATDLVAIAVAATEALPDGQSDLRDVAGEMAAACASGLGISLP